MVGAEQCLGPGDTDFFGGVDDGTTAVVALAGVALRVLVAQSGTQGCKHRR